MLGNADILLFPCMLSEHENNILFSSICGAIPQSSMFWGYRLLKFQRVWMKMEFRVVFRWWEAWEKTG